jgi:ABC-type transporter Mla MlaB component
MVKAGKRMGGLQGEAAPAKTVSQPQVVLQAVEAGAWLPADELRRRALESLERCGSDDGDACAVLHVETAGVESLDAATLQVLLALTGRQMQRGGSVALLHLSSALETCLRTVGATRCAVLEGGARG